MMCSERSNHEGYSIRKVLDRTSGTLSRQAIARLAR